MCHAFDKPGIYVVHVAGEVDPAWADRLGGLSINEPEITEECSPPVTKLVGWLPDQAALAGVLSTLYDNRYTLLYVRYLGASETEIPRDS